MKVGIVTMISDNYGNRLQNYALQQVLTEIGNKVETLENPWNDDDNSLLNRFIETLKSAVYYLIRRPKRYEKRIKFKHFNKTRISFSKYSLNKYQDRKNASIEYDLFICGSDQIWNSEGKQIGGKYFADFAEKDKRASYAASFGVDYICAERVDEFSNYLRGMKYISVREESGRRLVEQLTNSIINVHLDPTLLLPDSEWDKIIPKSNINRDYIFCYFLGKPSSKLIHRINMMGNEKGWEIVIICSYITSNYNYVGPEEFVSLIKHAEIVFTDSFHGTVFSIIYKKNFYTFNRNGVNEGMCSRITDLLNLLHLEDRFFSQDSSIIDAKEIHYDCLDAILNNERRKSVDYLKMITNIS